MSFISEVTIGTDVVMSFSSIRQFTIKCKNVEEFNDSDGRLKSILVNNEVVIEINSDLKIFHKEKILFLPITDIIRINSLEYKIVISKPNRSITYLLPLFFDKGQLDFRFVMNAYCGNEYENNYGEYFYILVYCVPYDKDWIKLDGTLTSHKSFISSKSYNKSTILYKFDTDSVKDDYTKIVKNGKYSLISNYNKNKILHFFSCKKDHVIYKILTKDKTRKRELEKSLDVKLSNDTELGSVFEKKEETYMKNNE